MDNLTLEELDLLKEAMESHIDLQNRARIAMKLTFERARPDHVDLLMDKIKQAIADLEFEEKSKPLNF